MKITYLITGLRLGGAETQLLLLAEHMQQAGHTVEVIAMESGGVMVPEFQKKNIPVIDLGISGASSLAKGYKKFKAAIHHFSPDVIHSHMVHANLFARFFKLFNRRFKLINTAHNIREGSGILMMGYSLTRWIPNWSTNVSQEAFDVFISKKYFSRKSASMLPNAIDTVKFCPGQLNTEHLRKEFNLPDNVFVFFTAGRLEAQKNHQMLLSAFERVQRRINHAVLIIAGEGPLEGSLKEMSTYLGITDQTIFAGRRADVPALMELCDCFILSSIYEGFGLVIGEAMAMMKPVIATDCGGVKEVMGGFGHLVDVNDVGAMARMMINTCKTAPLIDELIQERQHIEDHYGESLIVNKWILLYHQIQGL